jgi:hypothetical protein
MNTCLALALELNNWLNVQELTVEKILQTEEYADAILNNRYMGGNDELEFFAHFFGAEIYLLDLNFDSPKCFVFGKPGHTSQDYLPTPDESFDSDQDKEPLYKKRAYLIYTRAGYYSPVVFVPGSPNSGGIFRSSYVDRSTLENYDTISVFRSKSGPMEKRIQRMVKSIQRKDMTTNRVQWFSEADYILTDEI